MKVIAAPCLHYRRDERAFCCIQRNLLVVIVSGVLLFPFDPITLTICSNPSCSSSKSIEKTGYVENIVRQGVANRVLF